MKFAAVAVVILVVATTLLVVAAVVTVEIPLIVPTRVVLAGRVFFGVAAIVPILLLLAAAVVRTAVAYQKSVVGVGVVIVDNSLGYCCCHHCFVGSIWNLQKYPENLGKVLMLQVCDPIVSTQRQED